MNLELKEAIYIFIARKGKGELMKFKDFLKISIVVLILILSGCRQISEPPNLEITSGDTNIPYVIGKNTWNGTKYDREDTFVSFIKSKNEINYIAIGDEIQIKFMGKAPKEVQLQDYVLSTDGRSKYADNQIQIIDVKVKKNVISFNLPTNMAEFLSSDSDETILRGLRLVCTWGANECEYAFIIKIFDE